MVNGMDFFVWVLNSASRLFEISSASCFLKLCGRREESVPDLSPTLFRNGLRYTYTHILLYSDGANALEHGVTFSLRAKLFFFFFFRRNKKLREPFKSLPLKFICYPRRRESRDAENNGNNNTTTTANNNNI